MEIGGIIIRLKIKNYSFSSITGLLALLIFTVFTFTSLALYPNPYNPLYSWLSNLGNIYLNPSGAYFFNLGCILTGILLLPFFTGLYLWRPVKIWGKIILIIGMCIGIVASLSLIMVGVFPETHIQQHTMAAAVVFSSLFIIIIMISLALFNNPKFMRGVAYFGFLVILIDLLFQREFLIYKNMLSVFNPSTPVPGLEWAAVFASLLWVGILASNMIIKKV